MLPYFYSSFNYFKYTSRRFSLMKDISTFAISSLGNFYRDGKYYDFKYRKVNDHDFPSLADGIVIPHGIYDIADNFGYLTLGISKDTSEFFCDNLAAYWQSDLQWKYPGSLSENSASYLKHTGRGIWASYCIGDSQAGHFASPTNC
jgi:hypothetical protein